MTNTDQIAAALAWINGEGEEEDQWPSDAPAALAADYERQREEIKKLQVDYSDLAKEAQARFVHLEDQEEEIERLKRENQIFRNMCIDQFRNRGVLLEEARQLVDELVQEPLKSPS